jgi:transposase InsO family protein
VPGAGSGYYAWCKRTPSTRAQADAKLNAQMSAIHQRSRGTYGVPRINARTSGRAGIQVGRKRVARLMGATGLVGEPTQVSNHHGP